jgi:hypothetical protein
MPLNLAKFGYNIRHPDSKRCDALNMAIKEHGISCVVDCLEQIRKNSSAYGCQRACPNITQKIEHLHLKLTERDIVYVMGRDVEPKDNDTNAINDVDTQKSRQSRRAIVHIALKYMH